MSQNHVKKWVWDHHNNRKVRIVKTHRETICKEIVEMMGRGELVDGI